MSGYRAQVAEALRAIEITSPITYAWFGRRSRPLPSGLSVALTPEATRRYLTAVVEHELYRSFYTQGRPVPVPPEHEGAARQDPAFVDSLSRANSGSGGWDEGWRVAEVNGASVVVAREGLRVRARAAECRPASARRRPGAAVGVRRPKELPAISPGFYTALGDKELEASEIELRVYFNVGVEGAAALVGACTRLLNEARVAFSLKVVDSPAGFVRADPAVLYLATGDFERLRPVLSAIASACAPYLAVDPPAFSKPLAPGIAVGEHGRRLGGSFGSSRCRLVAEGLVAAYEGHGLVDRLEAVARRFAEAGLDLDTPYLAAGSTDRYEL